MKTPAALAVALVLFTGVLNPAIAQRRTPSNRELQALKEEIRILKEGQEAMRSDLREIKELLGRIAAGQPPAPTRAAFVSVDDDPYIGSPDARVVMIDFSEFQCPFCGRFVRDTKPLLERDYFKTGKVRYVFRDLPLEAIHPHAFKAAEAANCAGDQGKFWEMHNHLFQNQRALSPAHLTQYAQLLGLEIPKFTQCLETGKHADEIRRDIADAGAASIEGTPNFVIGLANPKNPRDPQIKVLKVITGAVQYVAFKSALDNALAIAEKN